MAYKYLGPADNVEYPQGSRRFYRPGDDIPLPKSLMEHMMRYGGHRFEDHDPALAEGVIGFTEQNLPPPAPRDDRGAPIVASAQTASAAAETKKD